MTCGKLQKKDIGSPQIHLFTSQTTFSSNDAYFIEHYETELRINCFEKRSVIKIQDQRFSFFKEITYNDEKT